MVMSNQRRKEKEEGEREEGEEKKRREDKGLKCIFSHPTEQGSKVFSTIFKAEPTQSVVGTTHSFNEHFETYSVRALGVYWQTRQTRKALAPRANGLQATVGAAGRGSQCRDNVRHSAGSRGNRKEGGWRGPSAQR